MYVLLEALVEQIAQRWDAEAQHVGDHVGFDKLSRVASKHDGDVHSSGPGSVDRDMEWNAGARGVLRSGGGDDEKARHSHQYGQWVKIAA